MPSAQHLRRPRSGQQSNIGVGLFGFLRLVADVASGRHRGKKRGHHRRESPAWHGRSQESGNAAGSSWLVRREVSLRQLGITACVLLALMWMAWRIIAETAAQNLTDTAPDAALRWFAQEPAALGQRAQQELSDKDGNLDTARDWAQRALRRNPLDVRALTLLGLIAERTGDQQTAEALMRISGARSWRDRTAHSWLFDHDVRRGDYAQALPHIDAIMRSDLESQAPLLPVLAALTIDPRAFKALTDFLATSPPWREWFLSQMSRRLANQSRLFQLYTALKESDNPPTTDELRPYLHRLINDGRFEQAHQMWLETLPPSLRTNDTFPFNRDFDHPVDGLPFNWDLETISGADVRIVVSPEGGKKRALTVQFSGTRIDFANVRQALMLPAGNYTLAGRVKADALRTDRGLWWRIFCANQPTKSLAQTQLVSAALPWTDFSVEFQVPANDCKAQWLKLELPARIASERKIEGQVWYQDLRITPKQAPATLPRPD